MWGCGDTLRAEKMALYDARLPDGKKPDEFVDIKNRKIIKKLNYFNHFFIALFYKKKNRSTKAHILLYKATFY